jgi:fumarate hydratase subunit beta
MKQITLPLMEQQITELAAGDMLLLSGVLYTARDAAHKRLYELIKTGQSLPFSLACAVIYYTGPCPAKPGQIINSCGPTSALRMDSYAPLLFDHGVKCTIAKGPVSQEVHDSIVRNHAIYLCATGGAGALISKCVVAAEVLAFSDLGAESVKKLTVVNMPLIVAIDCKGESLFH